MPEGLRGSTASLFAELEPPPVSVPGVVRFSVSGIPQTAGSKRAFPFKRPDGSIGVRVTDDNPQGRGWRALVVAEAQDAHQGSLLEGPLFLHVVFRFARPKGHFGTRGLLPSAPPFPAVKPDATKLLRALEDALTAVVWRDDAQVVAQTVRKVYGEPAGADVAIWRAGA